MSILEHKELVVGGVTIPPGKRKQIEIVVAKLFDYTEMTIPIAVVRGKEDGPILFVSAAIHGDEIFLLVSLETPARTIGKPQQAANPFPPDPVPNRLSWDRDGGSAGETWFRAAVSDRSADENPRSA